MLNYLCACGKLLFRGFLPIGTKIEDKCPRCKRVVKINIEPPQANYQIVGEQILKLSDSDKIELKEQFNNFCKV